VLCIASLPFLGVCDHPVSVVESVCVHLADRRCEIVAVEDHLTCSGTDLFGTNTATKSAMSTAQRLGLLDSEWEEFSEPCGESLARRGPECAATGEVTLVRPEIGYSA
jgi:hypothetical protein